MHPSFPSVAFSSSVRFLLSPVHWASCTHSWSYTSSINIPRSSVLFVLLLSSMHSQCIWSHLIQPNRNRCTQTAKTAISEPFILIGGVMSLHQTIEVAWCSVCWCYLWRVSEVLTLCWSRNNPFQLWAHWLSCCGCRRRKGGILVECESISEWALVGIAVLCAEATSGSLSRSFYLFLHDSIAAVHVWRGVVLVWRVSWKKKYEGQPGEMNDNLLLAIMPLTIKRLQPPKEPAANKTF